MAVIARRRLDTFGALRRHPNFRLYWVGALCSNIGTWMQTLAQGWLVYQLTGSALLLGTVAFLQGLPSLLLALVGGALTDRLERRRLMLATQAAQMVLALALAGLTLAGVVQVWQILAIAIAVVAIVIQGFALGTIPVVSLGLALTFGFYGYFRKTVAAPSAIGLFVETLLMTPFALAFIAYGWVTGGSGPVADPYLLTLLIVTGPATAIPLAGVHRPATPGQRIGRSSEAVYARPSACR